MRTIKFRAWDKLSNLFVNIHSVGINGIVYLDNGRKEYFLNSGTGYNIELMQYTGLKDKNGTEIYEGDILKNGVVVEWYEDSSEGWYGYSLGMKELEVIGNIYENPELLE